MLKNLNSLPLRRWLSVAILLPTASLAHAQAPTPATVVVRIDATKPHQTIANFAASDAWAGQFVGNWPAAKKDAIADLLFSQDKGIGLSMWRFNIGAGSA